MNTIDFIFSIILLLGLVKGYRRGLIIEFFTLMAFIIGIIIALTFTIPVVNWIGWEGSSPSIMAIITFIGLFILISWGVKILAVMIKKAIDLTIFGTFDTYLGAIIGLFKWAFIISSFIWILDSLNVDIIQENSKDSRIYPYLKSIAPIFTSWIGDLIPYLKELFHNLTEIGHENKGVFT